MLAVCPLAACFMFKKRANHVVQVTYINKLADDFCMKKSYKKKACVRLFLKRDQQISAHLLK